MKANRTERILFGIALILFGNGANFAGTFFRQIQVFYLRLQGLSLLDWLCLEQVKSR